MAIPATYAHTNLIARDWQALAAFYQTVFGCSPVPPERDLAGDAIERGSRVPGARLRGVHLRFPGHGEAGPTLEIFTYNTLIDAPAAAANRPGFGHIAFAVPDVPAARAAVLAAGGREYGDIVTTAAGARSLTWVYVHDPEGNLVELQSWSDA
jgi:catechol 2,3-dioxygenase-like lactoylglutathione lyase family enzyme